MKWINRLPVVSCQVSGIKIKLTSKWKQ